MNEEEFRSQLYMLGIRYQSAIREMNTSSDQYLKDQWRSRGYEVMDEIRDLERKYSRDRGVAAPTNDAHRALLNPEALDPAELGLWRQRLANKFAEGAHHDVMVYCASEIEKLGVPCSVQEFHCPHCQQSGSIVTQGSLGEQATTFGLHGHEYIGDGKFYCTKGKKRRIFQEPTLFQSNSPSEETPAELDAPPDPWIDYYDQLIKEWFDGEKALIDDLYPDPSKEAPIYRPLTPAEVHAAKIIGAFALGIIVMFISTLYLWA